MLYNPFNALSLLDFSVRSPSLDVRASFTPIPPPFLSERGEPEVIRDESGRRTKRAGGEEEREVSEGSRASG